MYSKKFAFFFVPVAPFLFYKKEYRINVCNSLIVHTYSLVSNPWILIQKRKWVRGLSQLYPIPMMKILVNILKQLHFIIQNPSLIWKLNSSSSHFVLLCCKCLKRIMFTLWKIVWKYVIDYMCDLGKTITALNLSFAVKCAMYKVWFGQFWDDNFSRCHGQFLIYY